MVLSGVSGTASLAFASDSVGDAPGESEPAPSLDQPNPTDSGAPVANSNSGDSADAGDANIVALLGNTGRLYIYLAPKTTDDTPSTEGGGLLTGPDGSEGDSSDADDANSGAGQNGDATGDAAGNVAGDGATKSPDTGGSSDGEGLHGSESPSGAGAIGGPGSAGSQEGTCGQGAAAGAEQPDGPDGAAGQHYPNVTGDAGVAGGDTAFDDAEVSAGFGGAVPRLLSSARVSRVISDGVSGRSVPDGVLSGSEADAGDVLSGYVEGSGASSGAVAGDTATGVVVGDGTLSGNTGSSEQGAKYYTLGDGSFGEGKAAPWHGDRDMVRTVQFGKGVKPLSMARWFSDLDKLESADFTNLDTSRVCDMSGLFSGCSSLTELDLSGFVTSCVTNMCSMFKGCSNITSLDLSSFDTSSLTSLDGMLEGCTSLASLDASSFTAEQLSTASVPTDNAGGFWRFNVPKGFEHHVVLREPTESERKAAGITDEGNEGGSKSPSDGTSENGTTKPDGAATANTGTGTGDKTSEGEEGGQPASSDNAGNSTEGAHQQEGSGGGTAPSSAGGTGQTYVTRYAPVSSSAVVDVARSISSGVASWAAQRADAMPTATRGDASGTQAMSTVPEAETALSAQAVGPANEADVGQGRAEEGLASRLIQALSTLVAQSVVESAFDPGTDPAVVAQAAMSVFEAMGFGAAVDKTLAIIAAVIGMLVSAGLILTLCFKIK